MQYMEVTVASFVIPRLKSTRACFFSALRAFAAQIKTHLLSFWLVRQFGEKTRDASDVKQVSRERWRIPSCLI